MPDANATPAAKVPDPTPDPDAEALKLLAALSPEDRAAVEKMAEPPAAPVNPGDTVTVKLGFPLDSFDTRVEGVGVLTRVPVQIPQSSLAAVLAAARKSHVTVTQIKEK